jgi:hypothetical protein
MHRLMIVVAAALLASAGPLSAQSIEYPSVAAALTALKAKPGVKISNNDGWLVIEDSADHTIWSFTPSNHYANPAVGRRSVVQQGSSIFVETRILCQAQKAACDRLRDDYALLDKRMNGAIQRDLQKKK